MKSALRGGMTALLVGTMGCLAAACGGDDTGDIGLSGGSAGTGGTAGSTGTAGSVQSGGSAGTAGSGQNGGSGGTSGGSGGTAGSGGAAGSGGNGGSAGTAGTMMEAGAKDGAAEATSDAAQDASAADAAADASTSDVTSSNDAAADSSSSDATDSGPCPVSRPTDGGSCTQNNLKCDYGGSSDAGFDGCVCRTVSSQVYQWSCTNPDGGAPAECPKGGSPGTGTSCSDAGASLKCRFGSTWCFCNQAGDTVPANTWDCI